MKFYLSFDQEHRKSRTVVEIYVDMKEKVAKLLFWNLWISGSISC